jgi:uncharacterized protein YcbX
MSEMGRIAAIFRYPVKSMLGEELDASPLGEDGIPGDRAWGLRDELRGDFFVGKRSPGLMSCRAWYDAADPTPSVPRIGLPDGQTFRADADGAAERVGRAIGRDVTLWPVVPDARSVAPRDDLPDEMRELLAREEGEPIPDFSNPPPALLEVYARNGPFFDAYPLLLLTRRSMQSLAGAGRELQIDVRRFRPNLLVEGAESGRFPEQDWIGRRVRIGSAVLAIQSTCIRCVMTTHGFADVAKDPRVMRTLVKAADGNLGVYATVEQPGDVRRGAALELLG